MRRAGIRDMPPGTQINFEEKQETKRLLQKAGSGSRILTSPIIMMIQLFSLDSMSLWSQC
jgi:hypothetical protein